MQHGIFDAEKIFLIQIRKIEIQVQCNPFGFLTVQPDSHGLKQIGQRDAAGHTLTGTKLRVTGNIRAQLQCAAQIEIPPGRRFALVTELFQRVGQQRAGWSAGGVQHNDMVQYLRHPAVVAFFEALLRFFDDGVLTTHECHIAFRNCCRGQGVEGCRVSIEVAEILHVNRTRIVMNRAVITAQREVFVEAFG